MRRQGARAPSHRRPRPPAHPALFARQCCDFWASKNYSLPSRRHHGGRGDTPRGRNPVGIAAAEDALWTEKIAAAEEEVRKARERLGSLKFQGHGADRAPL